MGKTDTRIVGVIQCAIALERCSGFSCALAFQQKTYHFQGYAESVLYIPISCGGCPGRRVSRYGAHVARKAKKLGIPKQDIAFHLTGCVVTDNGHYPRCPFKDHMKAMLEQKGFRVIEGGYEAHKSVERRAAGHYTAYESLRREVGDGV